MKKFLFTFILSAICGMASAQTLTIPGVQILQGGKASLSLIVNVGDKDVTGFQYEQLTMPTGFSITGKKVSAEWDATATFLLNGSKGSAASMDGIAIPKKEFEIATIEIQAAANLALGDYEISFPAGDFNFLDGKNYFPVADKVTCTVSVVNKLTVTLDEESTVAPTTANGVNVIVKRTFPADKWSTICLPFAMSNAQLATAFPGGVELGDFTSWISDENGEGDIVSISVGFTGVSAIEANHPYIIKVKEGATSFSVEDVNIAPEDEPAVEIGKKKAEKGFFTGTYVAGTEIPENNLFLNGGKFWYATASTKQMKAFRGFFEFYDVLSIAEEASARINITFDDITGIKSLNTDNGEEIYTLSGQRVEKAGKGVYIVNGKKVIKK